MINDITNKIIDRICPLWYIDNEIFIFIPNLKETNLFSGNFLDGMEIQDSKLYDNNQKVRDTVLRVIN